MNAPATPIVTALRIEGIRTPLAIPKTTMPANNDDKLLWSLRIGTESKTLLIHGTKKGAIKLMLIQAMIASSKTTPLMFFANDVTTCTI